MLVTYIFGVIFLLISFCIMAYNWKYPKDDGTPSLSEAIKSSKVVWGFWHTGERAKASFKYGSVTKILLLEPNENSEAFQHVLTEATGTATQKDILANIKLTTESALQNNIHVKWHNEVTSLSFMICDPSPNIDGELVKFSHRAFIVVQVLDRNLNIEEWSVYKKTEAKDRYAFNGYVKWFKEIWDNRSKPATSLPLIPYKKGFQTE